jgi:hypothetical protein
MDDDFDDFIFDLEIDSLSTEWAILPGIPFQYRQRNMVEEGRQRSYDPH